MAYTLDRFGSTYAGGVALPTALHPLSEGTGAVPSSMVDLPGGNAWDYLQSGIARPRYGLITHRGRVIAASDAARQTALDALYALIGQRNLLWKSNDGGTTNRWRYARCLDVRTDVGIGTFYGIVEMDFELEASVWSGAAHAETTTVVTEYTSVLTVNGGNARVRDAIITVTAVTSAITLVHVYKAGLFHWHYTGAIMAGESLIVNCGTKRVTRSGMDKFVYFVLLSDHADNDWMPLDAGENIIEVKCDGGAATSTFSLNYSDGWN